MLRVRANAWKMPGDAAGMYIHVYINTYSHTCIHAYMHAYMHTCIHAYMHTCMHTHTECRTRIQLHLGCSGNRNVLWKFFVLDSDFASCLLQRVEEKVFLDSGAVACGKQKLGAHAGWLADIVSARRLLSCKWPSTPPSLHQLPLTGALDLCSRPRRKDWEICQESFMHH